MKKIQVIAIDGPAGAGKSTVSPLVAQRVSLPYLDTGLMYRAVGYVALQQDIASEDHESVCSLVQSLSLEFHDDHSVSVNKEQVKSELRTPEVSKAASLFAQQQEVREALIALQRLWVSERNGGVVDGRDIASNVFPDAVCKIFLTADLSARAQRRSTDLGISSSEAAEEISNRDRADSERELHPLVIDEEAYVLDTTLLTISEVVETIANIFYKKGDEYGF